jgi:hypothetical protein
MNHSLPKHHCAKKWSYAVPAYNAFVEICVSFVDFGAERMNSRKGIRKGEGGEGKKKN